MVTGAGDTFDEYVYLVNSALEDGREDLADELADAYEREAANST